MVAQPELVRADPVMHAPRELSLADIIAIDKRVDACVREAVGIGMKFPNHGNDELFLTIFRTRLRQVVGPDATDRRLHSKAARVTVFAAITAGLHCSSEWDRLREEGRASGKKPGWAFVQFKLRFGVAPRFAQTRREQSLQKMGD